MLFVVVAVAFLYGLYLQTVKKTDTKITGQMVLPVITFPDTDCRSNLAMCTVSLDDRQIQFLLPNKAFYLQMFPVEVFLTGFDKKKVESVSVQFEMPGMDMGFNQIQLSVHKQAWYGKTILPLCASGLSDWNATVDVKSEEKIYRATFALVIVAKE